MVQKKWIWTIVHVCLTPSYGVTCVLGGVRRSLDKTLMTDKLGRRTVWQWSAVQSEAHSRKNEFDVRIQLLSLKLLMMINNDQCSIHQTPLGLAEIWHLHPLGLEYSPTELVMLMHCEWTPCIHHRSKTPPASIVWLNWSILYLIRSFYRGSRAVLDQSSIESLKYSLPACQTAVLVWSRSYDACTGWQRTGNINPRSCSSLRPLMTIKCSVTHTEHKHADKTKSNKQSIKCQGQLLNSRTVQLGALHLIKSHSHRSGCWGWE